MALATQSVKEFTNIRKSLPEIIIFEKPNTHPETFIQESAKMVISSCVGTKLFPSVTMAQLCLESGYGLKHIGAANNYFGFKGNGSPNEYWDGRVVIKDTIENYGNGDVQIKDGFRVYASMEMSLLDRNRLLHIKRYERVLGATTFEEQAQLIKDCGYATDPGYVGKLVSIINKFGLVKLDELKTEYEKISNK